MSSISTENFSNLKEKVIKGGIFLLLRQVIGLIINFSGVLVLTKIIGPKNYGIYSGNLGIILFLVVLGKIGMDAYLIRQERKPSIETFRTTFSLLILSSLFLSIICLIISPLIGKWLGNNEFILPFRVMILTLPLSIVTTVFTAYLEREIQYQLIAKIELIGIIIFYLVSIILALLKFKYWSPVIGYILWQFWNFLSSYNYLPIKLKPIWPIKKNTSEMLKYGLTFSFSSWIWSVRTLINPLIVGKFLGAEAVGIIALTIRIVESLSFAKNVIWRISISTFSRIQSDKHQLRATFEKVISITILLVAPILIAFLILGKPILSIIYGKEWLELLDLFPFLAISTIVGSLFSLHTSILYIYKKNLNVALFHFVNVTLFFITSYITVPKYGIIGYGLSEIFTLSSYFLVHKFLSKIFSISYKEAVIWILCFVPILFINKIGSTYKYFFLMPIVLVILLPSTREMIKQYFKEISLILNKK